MIIHGVSSKIATSIRVLLFPSPQGSVPGNSEFNNLLTRISEFFSKELGTVISRNDGLEKHRNLDARCRNYSSGHEINLDFRDQRWKTKAVEGA